MLDLFFHLSNLKFWLSQQSTFSSWSPSKNNQKTQDSHHNHWEEFGSKLVQTFQLWSEKTFESMKAGVSTLELNWEVDQRSLLQLIQLILLFAENSCAFSSVCMMKKNIKWKSLQATNINQPAQMFEIIKKEFLCHWQTSQYLCSPSSGGCCNLYKQVYFPTWAMRGNVPGTRVWWKDPQ